jgi:hypothetical protein
MTLSKPGMNLSRKPESKPLRNMIMEKPAATPRTNFIDFR